MSNLIINISSDFTDAPGARYKTDGPKSGEEFYVELLKPKFLEAQKCGEKLTVNLDNTWGYASSFISGSFGRLSVEFGAEEVFKHLELVSKDEPLLVQKVKDEITKPNSK